MPHFPRQDSGHEKTGRAWIARPANEPSEEVRLCNFTSSRIMLSPVDRRSSTSHQTGRRVTPRQAADQLGVSVEAIRGRIKRGKLPHVKEGGTVYVLLPIDQTTTARNQSNDQYGLVEDLRDRVRRLEHDLDVRSEEIRRKDHIILSLSQSNAEQARTIRAIEAPASTDEAQDAAQDADEGESRGTVPREPERTSSRRSLWSRIFDR